MINYATMSLKQHKPKITMTYDRKIRGSMSTTTTTIPFNDNNHRLVNPSSQNVETTNNWAKSMDGLDLDNITSSRLRNRKSSVKGLISEGGNSGKTSLLGKRPPHKSLSSSEEITESYSRLSVNDEPDPPPSKRRDTGSKGKVSGTKNQLDVFDFPDDDDNEPIRRFNNRSHTKTYDKSIRGLNKTSTKNKDDKSTQSFFKIPIQPIQNNVIDKPILEVKSPTKNFDDVRITRRMNKSDNLGGDVNGINENNTNGSLIRGMAENNTSKNIKVTHGIVKIPQNNLDSDIRMTHETKMISNNNLNNNGKNKTKSDDIRVARGMNKPIKKDNKRLGIFDFPDSDGELEENITKKKSLSSFTMSDPPKKTSKNLMDSSIKFDKSSTNFDQNSFSNVNTSSKVNSSSTRISRFLTTKTSKSAASTNNGHTDNHKNGSSSDRKSVNDDDVFDFVKFIRVEAKTKRNVRNQPKSGSHEQITGIVNDRTNNMLNDNIIQPVTPTKKNSQTSSKSTVTPKESFVNKTQTPKKPRKNHMLIDIPQAPSRPISEVGTPVSFLSFQQKKKPSESSVWDVVDAVTSPTDILLSPRKQNLVARMSKPVIPAKQDKSQSLSSWNQSAISIPKSKSQKMVDAKTKDDEILSYADELLASSKSIFDLQNSNPPSYNIPSGNAFGGQKTYGQGRTILGQDLDPMSLDSLSLDPIRDMEIDDNNVDDTNLAPKKHALKSSHELRVGGDYTRFTDEMDYILDGLENRSINVRRNSVMDLLSKLLDGDFLLKVRAHNYISKIYVILNGNQDSLIRCCFSFIVCMLMEDKHSSESLIQENGFIEFVVNLLNTSSDPLNTDIDSLKKSEKSFINDFKDIILKSMIFTKLSQISLKSIALRTLSSLSSLRTRHESVIKNRLRDSGCLLLVINILKSELELVNGLLSVIENGKPSSLQNATLDFMLIEQCLKILESATLFCSENQICIVEDKDLLHMLLELLLYCQVGTRGKNVEEASLALECLLGTLRVLINLTNENLPACQYVGSYLGMSILMRLATVGQLPSNEPPISNSGPFMIEVINIENSESVDAVKFDVLLLSIGLLINLVETDVNIQDEFRKVDQNPTCPGSRMCMRTCTCSSRESAVSCLVSLYNYQLEKGDDETDSNIVAAYMAVLLGLLIKNNEANQQLIIDRLPDRSVNSLINLLQQFVHFNELVGEEATANGHASGQMLMSSSSLNNDQPQLENQGRTIGDSFLEIVDILKSLES
ncbi:wings apart-like protein regulation of heterochromatin-domain-containing protein [Glomus cerebriforme]|uniref:Wings apart-like protein regulation of heterochromatin-domain-containing protein n=1 Tax=Glomus cerebriforme TaxID=658196 RepID=A0A397SJF0_9GLOM|nr:wings apart-like protein regulation of heterochromatin-domain-containing protein [Glomus cerebriforme]